MAEKNIVTEKLSGKDFKRPRYQRLVGSLRPGDVLVVQSIEITLTVFGSKITAAVSLPAYLPGGSRQNLPGSHTGFVQNKVQRKKSAGIHIVHDPIEGSCTIILHGPSMGPLQNPDRFQAFLTQISGNFWREDVRGD